MQNLIIRPLECGELDTALMLWNACRPADPITKRVFKRKIILDVNFDREGYLIALQNEKPVGFVYVIVRKAPLDNDGDLSCEVADINGFGTLCGNIEVGKALICAAEEYARKKGVKKLLVSPYKPYYFTQGFDTEREAEYIKLFSSVGYTRQADSYARDINLFAYQIPEEIIAARHRAEAAGFYIGPLTEDYLLAFWEYMNKYQLPSWRVRLRQLLRDTDDLCRVRIAAHCGEVIGFNVFGDPDGSPERFGPFGLREDFRGMKLGQILLSDCLYEMKCRGLHNAWMQSSKRGTAADNVYEKAGFKITRIHAPMEKDI